ncbi:MAG: hypothetical protein ACM3VT_10245 [Solirubrobacterales bacterium]
MVRLFRRFVSIITILAVVVIIGAIAAILFAGRLVKSGVESSGTKMLNVPVQVGKAGVSILGGSIDLQNLAVANPQGYDGPSLLTLKKVDIAADTGTLFGSQIVIKTMTLDQMEVFVEQKGLQNNLYEVIKPLRQPHEPTGKSLVIDNLTISNILVHISLPSLAGQEAKTVDVKVAPITMTELGRNERIDTPILISKILLAVAQGIADQSGGILPKETLGDISGVLDKAVDIGRILFGGKKSDGQTEQKTDSGDGKSITDSIKDIFGGSRKK